MQVLSDGNYAFLINQLFLSLKNWSVEYYNHDFSSEKLSQIQNDLVAYLSIKYNYYYFLFFLLHTLSDCSVLTFLLLISYASAKYAYQIYDYQSIILQFLIMFYKEVKAFSISYSKYN